MLSREYAGVYYEKHQGQVGVARKGSEKEGSQSPEGPWSKELGGFCIQMAQHRAVNGSDLLKLLGLLRRTEGEKGGVCQGTCSLGSQQVPGTVWCPPSSPALAFCNLDEEQQQKTSRAIYRDKAIPTAAEIRLQKKLAKIFFLELL